MVYKQSVFEMKKLLYTTVSEKFVYEIPKIKGSRFLGTLFPVETKEQAERCIADMQKQYHDASHNCYAYKVGIDVQKDLFGNMLINPNFVRAHDDGEPTNSAGKPMLSVLEGNQIQNVLLVVTRYFGGTLLGVGGLIQAYTQTAQETLKRASLIEKAIYEEIDILYSYNQVSLVSYLVEKYEMRILQENYGEQIQQKLQINRGRSEAFKKEVFEKSNGTIVI
jgi:uncharacterized YigZ family protein